MDDRPPPLLPAHRYVAIALRCQGCGYDLKGLEASGQCPECGRPVWPQLVRRIDPEARLLPTLRNPHGVGNAVVWLTGGLLLAAILAAARPVGLALDRLGTTGLHSVSRWTPVWLPVAAGIIGVLCLPAIRVIAPPRRLEPGGAVWRDLWMLGLGLAGWSATCFATGMIDIRTAQGPATPGPWREVMVLLGCGAAILALLGGRGVLSVIGQRSRQYRTSRSGRQSAEAMILAIAALAVGRIVRLIALEQTPTPGWVSIGTAMIWTSSALIIIGLAYLLVNAWWIRRALWRPPVAFQEALTDDPSTLRAVRPEPEPEAIDDADDENEDEEREATDG